MVEGGYVWGRGTLDNKSNLISQLEAVERLIQAGFKPQRTVYLVFGHDEEVGGRDGAAAIVALLKQRGVQLDFVLDEGLVVTEGILPGVEAPLALIGLAEKGSLSLRLIAKAAPGHSSMPPAAAGASAIADQVYRFMPIRFTPPDLARLHGTDEHIAITQLADTVRFYHRFISQAAR